MTRIELTCEASAAAECHALHSALAGQSPKAEIVLLPPSDPLDMSSEAALRVHLNILRREPDFIIAQLLWALPGEEAVPGPEVETSTIDRTLTPQAQKGLAQGLLQVSDLPI